MTATVSPVRSVISESSSKLKYSSLCDSTTLSDITSKLKNNYKFWIYRWSPALINLFNYCRKAKTRMQVLCEVL